MKKREPISHIMSSELVTVNVNTPLRETRELFKKNNIEIPYPQQDLHIKTSDLKLVKE